MALFVGSPTLLEPIPALEIAGSGLGRIEFLGGGQACFVFYRNCIATGSTSPERAVCGRVFAPIAAIPEAIDLLAAALAAAGKSLN